MRLQKENPASAGTGHGAKTLTGFDNISPHEDTKSGDKQQALTALNRSHFPAKVSGENLCFSAVPVGTRWATIMRVPDSGALHFGDFPSRKEAMQVATRMADFTGGRVEQ